MLKSNYSGRLEAGCDEVGRGCLAGPVVAAAVILPNDFKHEEIKDSKQLSENQRIEFADYIKEEAVGYAIAELDHHQIDKLNIANASFKAMSLAIDGLKVQPEFLLIDGNRFTGYPGITHKCVVKGDSKFLSIAAASIIAKVHRDELMKKWAEKYPQYGWESNMGYATSEHKAAISEFGLSEIHRRSFVPDMDQLPLF